MERGLKLKAEDVFARLTVEVARDKSKIHTLETEVSRQRWEIDKLQSDATGESSGPMSFLLSDLRCLFDTVSVMAWAGLEDKLTEEVVKSRELGGSLQKEHDEHEALRVTVGLAYDDLSLTPKQEGISLVVRATWIVNLACETMRLALSFGVHHRLRSPVLTMRTSTWWR
jgi:hypothetical protein